MADSLTLISKAEKILKDQDKEDGNVTVYTSGGHVFKGKILSVNPGYLHLELLDGSNELIHPNELVSVNVE